MVTVLRAVWRCKCGYWVPRLSALRPPCPYCSVSISPNHKKTMRYMHAAVRSDPKEAPMADKIHVYKDSAGEFRWHKKSPNGDIVADSGEGYGSRLAAVAAAEREAEGTDDEVIVDAEDPA